MGFVDDLLKINLKNSRGLNSKLKFLGQLIIALIALYILIGDIVRKTRSILEELNQISVDRDRDHVVSNRGEHIIASAISLLEQIDTYYDESTAKDLQNRLVNSIKGRDGKKFSRGIGKIIKESQKENKDAD